jgi:hypothetical protein
MKYLIIQFRFAYENPELEKKAIQKLNTLRQKKRFFIIYFAEFERTILEIEEFN